MSALRLAALSATLLLLAACAPSGQGELQDWMRAQYSEAKAGVEPISEPKKFVPQSYTQAGALDPYSVQRLAQSIKKDFARVSDNAALVAPELVRRKEALESFPVDAVAMVGYLTKVGQPVALVRVENLLYQVHEGNYLGQNYGRITKIGESSIDLREIVQDASGEWVERSVKLQLLESSKK